MKGKGDMAKEKKSKKSEPIINGLAPSLATLGVMAGLTGMMGSLIGGTKMFGEQIPRGIVRELMEGVMDGLTIFFQGQIDDLKTAKEKLVEKNQELEETNERLSEENEAFKNQIGEAIKEKDKQEKKGKCRKCGARLDSKNKCGLCIRHK